MAWLRWQPEQVWRHWRRAAIRTTGERAQKKAIEEKARAEYRNTERGRHEKNSKGIYYTNGNYEAFARPRKPEGVDEKSAYIVGSGLASLAHPASW